MYILCTFAQLKMIINFLTLISFLSYLMKVLQSLKVLLYLRPSALYQVSRQIAYALHELLRTNAANIHSRSDWALIFSLLERVGAGTKPPRDLTSPSPSPVDSPNKVSEIVQSGKNRNLFRVSSFMLLPSYYILYKISVFFDMILYMILI